MRDRYHEAHLLSLGEDLRPGSFIHGGWNQLVGLSYERRIYAFRFNTTEEQDNEFIASMNRGGNQSSFDLLFNNCSDFARMTLNMYFPGSFRRSMFPDAGMTTPKQIAYKLVHYAQRHPETELTVFEISQIPGYRRMSRSNKSIAESLSTTAYAVPIAILNPYLAGGLFVDYLVRGRYHIIPQHPQLLEPENVAALTAAGWPEENPDSASAQAPSAAVSESARSGTAVTANPGLTEIKDTHE
jgi:hypothetical protein